MKLLLEQLQVCIFAEIVFWVRCTFNPLTAELSQNRQFLNVKSVFFFGHHNAKWELDLFGKLSFCYQKDRFPETRYKNAKYFNLGA